MKETKKKLLQETTAILKKLDRESLAIIRSNAEKISFDVPIVANSREDAPEKRTFHEKFTEVPDLP